MSRTKNVIKNFWFEITYEVVFLLLGLVVPRYVINVYGSEVNGLSSTITQIMKVLLTMNAGIVTASMYSLYKPVSENAFVEINEKIAAIVNYYKKISIWFIACTVIVAVVSGLFLDSELPKYTITIATLIVGLKYVVEFIVTTKYRVVFSVYQKKYIVSIAFVIEQLCYYGWMLICVVNRFYFLYMYAGLIISILAKYVFYVVVLKKEIPKGVNLSYHSNDSLIPNRSYAFANELSHSVTTASIPIIMSFMYGLEESSIFSIYYYVFRMLAMACEAVFGAFAPSFGNLVASGQDDKIRDVFDIFRFSLNFFVTVLYSVAIIMIIPFVSVYVKDLSAPQYINPILAGIVLVYGYFYACRTPYNIFVSTNGLFSETWKQPVLSCALSLLISIVLGSIRYEFIILGPLSFYATNFVYQYFKTAKLKPQYTMRKSILYYAVSGVFLALTALITITLDIKANSLLEWIAIASIAFVSVFLTEAALTFAIFKKKTLQSVVFLRNRVKVKKA